MILTIIMMITILIVILLMIIMMTMILIIIIGLLMRHLSRSFEGSVSRSHEEEPLSSRPPFVKHPRDTSDHCASFFRKGGWYGWKPSSSSDFSIRAFRAYPLIETKQTVPCRAIRGTSISVNSTLPPSYSCCAKSGARTPCTQTRLQISTSALK